MTWGGAGTPDRYKVKHVGGNTNNAPGTLPIKQSEIARRPVTKLIMGDWVWFPDRNIGSIKSSWHNDRGKPVFLLLWGDLHVENFKFPADYKNYDGQPADINFNWW
jgi:hypothetical protein